MEKVSKMGKGGKRIVWGGESGEDGLDSYGANAPLNDREGQAGKLEPDCHGALARLAEDGLGL
ncbi:MAG: hypothetical protein LBS99_07400 [Clostridiales bacterium]|nr:hypothetical protein [Clostridiales bacterium]